MPGLIIDGRVEQISGLDIINYKDDSRLKLKPGEDMRARHTRWIRSIVLHNTKNVPTTVHPGKGPSTDLAHRISRLWSTDARNAGAHLSVDWDGAISCHCDLVQDAAYHASSMNENSIGIEIYEDANGVVYEYQLGVVIKLVKWLCRRFGIQMQIPKVMDNGEIARIKVGGDDCVGVFGHCHQWGGKKSDPGFDIFELLAASGFKEFNFAAPSTTGGRSPLPTPADKLYWKALQIQLGLNSDGIPGPKTRDALQVRGFAYGLYDWQTIIQP